MPTQAQRIADTFRRNLNSFEKAGAHLPEGSEHARLNGASSLNWVAGHVLASRLLVLGFLDRALPGPDVTDVRARYGKGTQPDPQNALPLRELLRHLAATQDILAAALPTADLSPSMASPFGQMPLGDVIDFFAWHEGYHAGQAALLHHQLSGQ